MRENAVLCYDGSRASLGQDSSPYPTGLWDLMGDTSSCHLSQQTAERAWEVGRQDTLATGDPGWAGSGCVLPYLATQQLELGFRFQLVGFLPIRTVN